MRRCKEGWRRTAVALRQVGANGEIVLLQLDDLDWRTGEIVVHGKGRIVERLPLLAEIDEALTTYLCEDRGGGAPRRVFLRRLAPRSGLAGPAARAFLPLLGIRQRACGGVFFGGRRPSVSRPQLHLQERCSIGHIVFTRSARRSKPQRMSVASAASQIRVLCARSSTRKLGSPITPPSPAPPARRADDPPRNQAQSPDSAPARKRTSIALWLPPVRSCCPAAGAVTSTNPQPSLSRSRFFHAWNSHTRKPRSPQNAFTLGPLLTCSDTSPRHLDRARVS